jgi:hypothetical protein
MSSAHNRVADLAKAEDLDQQKNTSGDISDGRHLKTEPVADIKKWSARAYCQLNEKVIVCERQ